MSVRSVVAFNLAMVLAVIAVSRVSAQNAETPSPAAACAGNEVELPAFTPEREVAALEFVAQHHAALGQVLAQLKGLKRDQYEQAIRELFQAREKLAAIRIRDQQLHGLMLEAWQVDSQIKLLAARHAFAAGKDEVAAAEMKNLLYKHVDLQRMVVEHNRFRLLEQLDNMNMNIQWLSEKREELVDRRFRNLTKVRPNPAAKPSGQPATAGSADAARESSSK